MAKINSNATIIDNPVCFRYITRCSHNVAYKNWVSDEYAILVFLVLDFSTVLPLLFFLLTKWIMHLITDCSTRTATKLVLQFQKGIRIIKKENKNNKNKNKNKKR
jgi:hypothetical protein